MSSNRQRRRQLSSQRGELRPGIELSDEAESWALFPDEDYATSRRRARDRKVRMLCAQVGHALDFALTEEAPEVAEHAMVEAVEPDPHGGRLLVLLRAFELDELETEALQEHVQHARGRLRTSVANYIHRKRAPELVFIVIGAQEVEVA